MLAGSSQILVHNSDDKCKKKETPELWHAGRDDQIDTDPQDPLPRSSMRQKGGNLEPGFHTYVVMPDSSVRSFHESAEQPGKSFGHTSLTGGKPVIMAGTFNIDDNGRMIDFDNWSGHYHPGRRGKEAVTQEMSGKLEGVARDALTAHGYDVGDAVWDPLLFAGH